MTKEQFLSKVDEMTGEDFKKFIMERANKAWNSGAIDHDSFEDNYLLPKIFLSAMGEEIKFQYKPHSNKDIDLRDELITIL